MSTKNISIQSKFTDEHGKVQVVLDTNDNGIHSYQVVEFNSPLYKQLIKPQIPQKIAKTGAKIPPKLPPKLKLIKKGGFGKNFKNININKHKQTVQRRIKEKSEFSSLPELMQQYKLPVNVIGRHSSRLYFDFTDPSPDTLPNIIKDLYKSSNKAFKLNISFGFVLFSQEEGTEIYKEYMPMNNNNIWATPMVLHNNIDLSKILDTIKKLDYINVITQNRPSSKWRFSKFLNIMINVTYQENVMGAKVEMPEYLIRHKAIMTINFDDNMCFWRCMALYKNTDLMPKRSTTAAKSLFKEYYKTTTVKDYKGVDLDLELLDIETYFKINIKIYELDINRKAAVYKRSTSEYQDTLYLNLFSNHLSYIKYFDNYANSFRCNQCNKCFDEERRLTTHMKTACTYGIQRRIFKGGEYKAEMSIFDKLRSKNIKVPKDSFHELFICYDFETIITDNIHEPISVSVCSNIDNFTKPKCFVRNKNMTVQELVDKFVTHLILVSNRARELLKIKFKKIIEQIEKSDDQKLIQQFNQYISQTPVLGFNSGKYDINTIKQNLFFSFSKLDQTVKYTVKTGNNYRCLTTNDIQMLDICNYLAPCSYDQFIKAYDCKVTKSVFPYEYMTIKKLKETQIPKYEDFYSSLKESNITIEQYEEAHTAWKKHDMKTMKDFLIYYNNLDTIPFVEAVQKMVLFYKNKEIDLFKDGISISGISNKYLFKSTKAKFSLFKPEDSELYDTLRTGLIGGPAIVFNRYHEKDITKIKDNKIAKKILGYDANSLYLDSLSKQMPTNGYENVMINQSIDYYIKEILEDRIYGFIQCDIHVPDELKSKFDQFPPIFKNAEIKVSDVGEFMQKSCFKSMSPDKILGQKLISSMFGKNILLGTPLVKWYIQNGLKITNIALILKYNPDECFKKFADSIIDARRLGDACSSKKIIGETMKLIGNSAYGKTITNKSKYCKTTYVDDSCVNKNINNPFFKEINELSNNQNEIIKSSASQIMDLPIQIGIMVYQLSKLRILEFVYDCIDKYIEREDYDIMYMDTDSIYLCLSKNSISELVKPHMIEDYNENKHKFFVDDTITESKRSLGLFKLEYEGDGMCCLNSKSYYCWNSESNSDKGSKSSKGSAKGVQKRNNLQKEQYMAVLSSKENLYVKNKGFKSSNNQMKSYEQSKIGLSFCYIQRKVLENCYSTTCLDI